MASAKSTALALVPEPGAWPMLQSLRLAHDRHVRIWPPHINILYPFVPESEFTAAAAKLGAVLDAQSPLKLRFNRKVCLGSVAVLIPECDSDPGLARLHAACVAAFPELPPPRHEFLPHLTIGNFRSEQECRDFLDACPPFSLEAEVACLSLLARPSVPQPFRTVARLVLGPGEERVLPGDPHPYAFRPPRPAEADAERSAGPANFYQRDGTNIRLVFKLEEDAAAPGPGDARSPAQRRTLFVIDRSGSMSGAYEQVRSAVRYMDTETQGSRHQLDFLIYNDKAVLANAKEVLDSAAGGMTSFEAAFDKISEYLCKQQAEGDEGLDELTVVFMTDGQDNSSKHLAASSDNLRACLSKRGAIVHAIGFTQSHDRTFLEEVCSLGHRPGIYRYAGESGTLEQTLSELFDFVDVNTKVKILIGDHEMVCDAQSCGDGQVSFDLLVPVEQLGAAVPTGTGPCHVCIAGSTDVELVPVQPDAMFVIRCVDEQEITTQADLDRAQEALNGLPVKGASKAQRQALSDARQEAQRRLDKYYQLFADGARAAVHASGANIAAELSSLRHEATLSKARRVRAMAKRATVNAASAQLLDALLHSLPPPAPQELAALEEQQLTCSLSGDSPVEVMRNSHRDFFVFPLRVRRPEDVIDAPTALDVVQVLAGSYSNEAFRAAVEHAVRTAGPAQAHGGFTGTVRTPMALGSDVGLFRGPDGQQMNACLPLYLSEAHFARVLVQIKPILGYFFTLDPLGYKGDQLVALYGVLGAMHCMRARSTVSPEDEPRLVGTWGDWLINDFCSLCRGLRPLTMEYLEQGSYTGTVRGDLLADFLASPAGRTKERQPSLAVLIGWAAAIGAEPTPHFHAAFVEELWRRNFTALYKGQPRAPIVEILERLLYGPSTVAEGDAAAEDGGGAARNNAAKDREFALWARYLRGDLPKQQAQEVARKYKAGLPGGSVGPAVEGLLCADAEFKPRELLRYEDAPAFFDAIVEEELSKIRRANSFVAPLYSGRPYGEGFEPAERRLMLIQALQHAGNDVMNEAVASGRYVDTFECFQVPDGEARVCRWLHEHFEQRRQERQRECIEQRNALATARRIVAAADLDAFAGRCAVSCPTRGGPVFHCLVALLGSCGEAKTVPARVPNLREKVKALMTGTIGEFSFLAEGSSWIHCPLETARRFQEVVGEEEFMQIELAMRGTWGHVYRVSDIPNRHGHCNSKPNPALTQAFTSFNLGGT